MEHRRELYTPRICLWFVTSGLLPKNAGTAVHFARDLHLLPGAEDGTSSRVRIEQSEILYRKGKLSLRISELPCLVQEKGKIGFLDYVPTPAQCKEAELVGTVNSRKNSLSILEIVETDETLSAGYSAKKALVESSAAIPVGTISPARPFGLSKFRIVSANTA